MSAVAPPPVDLTMCSLRLLAGSEHIGERLAGAPRKGRRTGLLPLLGFGALSAAAAGLGALVTMRPRNIAWYRAIAKPSFTPPDRAFGVVWPVLYGLTAWSGARVWRARGTHPAANRALVLWGAQLASNAALAMAPYLAWLAFAGVINAGVVTANRGLLRRLLAAG